MGGIALAWATGIGILSYRSVKANHGPPIPGALLATSGLFVLLAVLAQAEQARFLATTLAWGFDAAAFMNLFPAVTSGTGGKTDFAPTPSGKAPPSIGSTA